MKVERHLAIQKKIVFFRRLIKYIKLYLISKINTIFLLIPLFQFYFRFVYKQSLKISVVKVSLVLCLLLFFQLHSRIVFLSFVLVLILFRPLSLFFKYCVCFFLSNGSQYHIGSKRGLESNFYIAHKFKSIKFNIYWLNVSSRCYYLLPFAF